MAASNSTTSRVSAPHPDCHGRVRVVMRKDRKFRYVEVTCGGKLCLTCRPVWEDRQISRLTPHVADGAWLLTTPTVRWQPLRRRLIRRGISYVKAVTTDGVRLLLSEEFAGAEPLDPDDALNCLRSLVAASLPRTHLRVGGRWRNPVGEPKPRPEGWRRVKLAKPPSLSFLLCALKQQGIEPAVRSGQWGSLLEWETPPDEEPWSHFSKVLSGVYKKETIADQDERTDPGVFANPTASSAIALTR